MSLSFLSFIGRPDVFLVTVSTIIILVAITISGMVQTDDESDESPPFSQVITVGPVWPTTAWACTSDADYMVYATIRSLAGAQLTIAITGLGSQSLYTFNPSDLYSFSVGGPAGTTMTLTRAGTITGFVTLQTTEGATASCTSG